MKNDRRVVVCLVEDDNGDLLYGKRNDTKKYCLPAGRLKIKESPIEGACREFREETGLEAQKVELVKIEYISKKRLMIYLFKITDYTGDIDLSQDPDKEFSVVEFRNPMDIIDEMKVPLKEDIALRYYSEN